MFLLLIISANPCLPFSGVFDHFVFSVISCWDLPVCPDFILQFFHYRLLVSFYLFDQLLVKHSVLSFPSSYHCLTLFKL